MKRCLSVLLLICLLVSALAGCEMPRQEDDGRLKVVTTMFPPYDFVRQLAGEHVSLKMLIRPGTETHTYEPSPQDIIAVQNCDLFVYAGGESDTWISGMLEDLNSNGTKIISMIDCVEGLAEEDPMGGGEHHHNHHHHHHEEGEECHMHEYDEHVWTSLQNDIQICAAITDALCEVDPANAADYRANYSGYSADLQELDDEFRDLVDHSGRRLLVFGDRFPLRYFVESYGLSYYAAFPGCAESTEPNAATLAFLIETVREEKIPVIFQNELSSGQIAAAIAEETGTKVDTFYSCHTLSRTDFENGETFLSLMRRNLPVLEEALNLGTD